EGSLAVDLVEPHVAWVDFTVAVRVRERAIFSRDDGRQLRIANGDGDGAQRFTDNTRGAAIADPVDEGNAAAGCDDRHIRAIGVIGVATYAGDGSPGVAHIGRTHVLDQRKLADDGGFLGADWCTAHKGQ